MADVMDAIVDEVLKTVQGRLADLELDATARRTELSRLEAELDVARTEIATLQRLGADLARRLDRVERRLDSTDAAGSEA